MFSSFSFSISSFSITITTIFFCSLFIFNVEMKVISCEVWNYLLYQNFKNVRLDNLIVIKPVILWSFSITKQIILN